MVLGVLAVENKGHCQPKVRPKSVNQHGPAHICGVVDVQVDGFVGRVEHELKEGDDDELERTGSSQDCPHGNESCCSRKI